MAGPLEDILGSVQEAFLPGGALSFERAARGVEGLLSGGDFPTEFKEAQAAQAAARKDPDTDDIFAALLREKTENILSLARSAKTGDDILALDEARVDLIGFTTDLPSMRERIGLLENLPDFSEDATAEEIISAFSEVIPQLAIEEEEDAALSPEDQAFADLQTRSMELDVSLKEQQLDSAKKANQQTGMMTLLNMLPSSARSSTIASIMETPSLREQLFPGLFGGEGGASVGGSAEGDVFEILNQFGGGE